MATDRWCSKNDGNKIRDRWSLFLKENRPNHDENYCILGANSTASNRTYPEIQVLNYVGKVEIRVSCVSAEAPFRPHPNKLVGENCSEGVYTVQCDITKDNREWELRNVGIQCVSKKTRESLDLRKWKHVDPFQTGFCDEWMSCNRVRLGIEVFHADAGGRLRFPMQPLATDQITAFVPPLIITMQSQCSGPAEGGTRLLFFTEMLPLAQLHVRFSEERTGWQAEAPVLNIHKRCGVAVIVPPYRDTSTLTPALVKVRLCRSSVGNEEIDVHSQSSPVDYVYEPVGRPKCVRPTSGGPAPKQRRVDEKVLHPYLLGDSNDNSSACGSTVENMFRTSASVSDLDSESSFNTLSRHFFSTLGYYEQSRSLSPSPPIEPLSELFSTLQMEPSSQTGHSLQRLEEHQLGDPRPERASNASQLSRFGSPNATAESYMRQFAPSHGMGLSTQMPQSSLKEHQPSVSPKTGQSAQVGESPQMGSYRQSPHQGQSTQMGQPSQIGQSSQSPRVVRQPCVSHNEIPSQACKQRFASAYSTAGDKGQNAQAPQMEQSPQTRESPQMGQSPPTEESPQMGQSPLIGTSPQMGRSPQARETPQRRQFPQMGIDVQLQLELDRSAERALRAEGVNARVIIDGHFNLESAESTGEL